jgi:hypothetical protein
VGGEGYIPIPIPYDRQPIIDSNFDCILSHATLMSIASPQGCVDFGELFLILVTQMKVWFDKFKGTPQ